MCLKNVEINEPDNQYKKSIVLFLDILGFSNMVKNSKEEDVEQIFEILRYINAWNSKDGVNDLIEAKDLVDENYIDYATIDFKKIKEELKVSYFSDSLVVTLSYSDDEFNKKLFLMVRATAYLQTKLAAANYFTRGGIAIGNMFHTGNIFFGPAFLEAYELENLANYPRVILSRNIEKNVDFKMPYLKKAEDGIWYIDFLAFAKNTENPTNPYISLIKEKINSNIAKNIDNIKIRSKYTWLKKQLKKINHTRGKQK